LINYQAAAKAKENAAAAVDKYAPPPLLAVTLQKSQNAFQAYNMLGQNTPVMMQRILGGAITGSILPLSISGTLPSLPASYDLSTHYSVFCLPQELGPLASSDCASAQGMQGADINAATLLNATRLDDTNQLALLAVDGLIRNITELNYAPMLGMSNGHLSDLPAGRQEQLKRRLNQVAQSSVAMNSFSNMFAERVPQSLSPFTTQGQQPPASATKLDQSLLEVIQEESTRRFLDPTWSTQMLQASDSAMLREMANMESFRLYMDYMRYMQMERIEALLATLLSTQLNAARTIQFTPQAPVPASPAPAAQQ